MSTVEVQHGEHSNRNVNSGSDHVPDGAPDAMAATAASLTKRGFSDRELSEIKVELGSEAYRHPCAFDTDRHYVARELVRRAIDAERERVLRLILVWWDRRITDEQLVNELGYGEDEVPAHLRTLLTPHSAWQKI